MSSKIEITKVCQHCGKEFIAKTTVTKFCGHACAAKSYKERKKTEKLNRVKSPTGQRTDYNFSQLNEKEYLSIADTCKTESMVSAIRKSKKAACWFKCECLPISARTAPETGAIGIV